MSRGRKPISNFNGSKWETVFFNSVGTYVQYINIQLSKENNFEPLSNHLKIIGGYAFKTAEYKSHGVPIIRISDFNNEQIDLKNVVYYQETKELDKYELDEGDIIIALTGGTIAKLAIVQPGLGKIYLNQRVGKFQALKPDEFEVEYIYWLARSIQSIIKDLAWGAAIPNVSPKQIEELKFPFPKKEIQRGIIDFLNDLKNNNLKEDKIYFDESIENEIISLQEKQITTSLISTELTHQLDLVKQMRQAFLREAMQGKLTAAWRAVNPDTEPASQLLARIKAEKEKLVKEGKLKKQKLLPPIKAEEIPFEIPEVWEWCRLGEVSFSISTGPFGTMLHKSDYVTKGIPLINPMNLINGEILPSDKMMVDEQTKNRLKSYILKTGDIVIGRRGEMGRCAVVTERENGWLCGTGSFFLKLHNCIFRPFFVKVMSTDFTKEILLGNSVGSTMNNLNHRILNNLTIPVPAFTEQQHIVSKLNELMYLCDQLEGRIKASQQQHELLLQQVLREALSG